MFAMLETTARQKPPAFVLPIAVALHIAGILTILSAQYWHVGTVAEPPENVIFFDLRPPEVPLEPVRQLARPAAGPKPAAAKPAVVQPAAPQPVHTVQQPATVTDLPPALDAPPIDQREEAGPPSTGRGNGSGGGGGESNGSGGKGDGGPSPEAVPLRVGGEVTPPVRIEATSVRPQYTEMARRARLSGVVIAEAVIDEQGNVTQIRIVQPLPMGLDSEAVAAMAQWKFRPATLHGQPVKVVYRLLVHFEAQ